MWKGPSFLVWCHIAIQFYHLVHSPQIGPRANRIVRVFAMRVKGFVAGYKNPLVLNQMHERVLISPTTHKLSTKSRDAQRSQTSR